MSGIPGNDSGQFFKWYGGNVLVASMSGTGAFSATGNVTGGNITTGGQVSATGNITGANLAVSGVININNQRAATVDDAIALSIALG